MDAPRSRVVHKPHHGGAGREARTGDTTEHDVHGATACTHTRHPARLTLWCVSSCMHLLPPTPPTAPGLIAADERPLAWVTDTVEAGDAHTAALRVEELVAYAHKTSATTFAPCSEGGPAALPPTPQEGHLRMSKLHAFNGTYVRPTRAVQWRSKP